MKLTELEQNACAVVTKLHGGGALRQRLLDMGFTRGAEVRLLRYAPLKDPVEVRVRGTNLALRRQDAELIEVDRCPGDGGESARKLPRIALAGNPNCGKTSLFNLLTGADQEVGNFPGVTVEYVRGKTRMGRTRCEVVDLPGIYSLSAYSPDEVVSRDYLLREKPELLVNVVDASMLERQLYLTVQLLELHKPMVLVLNMIDIARRHGVTIETKKLSEMLGIPVIESNAGSAEGLENIRAVCEEALARPPVPKLLPYSHELEDTLDPVEEALSAAAGGTVPADFEIRYLALKLLEHDTVALPQFGSSAAMTAVLEQAEKNLRRHSGEDPATAISEARLAIASGLTKSCVRVAAPNRVGFTERIDAVVCHRLFGPLLLAGVVYALFGIIFAVAEKVPWIPLFDGSWTSPCGLLEKCFAFLGDWASARIGNEALRSLVCDGVIGGVGGVLSFVPLIFVMFFCVAFLEDTGYIARVAFIMDRILRVFGLQGKSIMAMIVSGGLGGGGCAVPGILATRTMPERRDRLITILVAPMMNCGAKFPLYALLTGAFFTRHQGLMMFLLWLLSWCLSMTAAVILRKFVIRGEQTPFIMELPVYHLPKLRGVLRHTWSRTWMYIRKAGTIILGISVALWALMYFPSPDPKPFEERQAEVERTLTPETPEYTAALAQIGEDEAQARLRSSLAGRVGELLTPISQLAGFDWKENVALIGGVAAKEIVVGTLATAYYMGGETASGDNRGLAAKLQQSEEWNPVKAFALMLFVMLYAPCAATLAVIRKETNSWKFTFFSLAFSTTFAFAVAVLAYQVGRLFWS